MNPQLEIFYQSQSPRKVLDSKLAPIFNRIRARHIHCVSQLQKEHVQNLDQLQTQQSKTLPVFYPNEKKEKKTVPSSQKKYTHQLKTISRKMPQTVQSKPTQKIVYVSPNSKVKKHLVDSIDYHGIQDALFREKSRVNRFQDFCRTLRKKERWMSLRPSSIQKQFQEDFERTTVDLFATVKDNIKNPFRVTRKERSPISNNFQHLIQKQPLSRQSHL